MTDEKHAAEIRARAITIDHDIPIPKQQRKSNGYPFTQMKVGDSFAVPIPPADSTEELNRVIRRVRHALVGRAGGIARFHQMDAKFVTRYMPDEKAVRIWRVAKPGERK